VIKGKAGVQAKNAVFRLNSCFSFYHIWVTHGSKDDVLQCRILEKHERQENVKAMQADSTDQSRSHVTEPSSSSYWQETVSHPVLSDDLPSGADVAIIGGGVLGSAICYWLARAGIAAIVLERTRLAFEASGRNGGFVSIGPAESYTGAIARLGYETARAVLDLTRENQVLLRRLLDEEQIACEYREPGMLSLALDTHRLEALTQEVAALQAEGVAAKLLDRAEVQELVRTPPGPEIVGGKFLPEGGTIHPVRLVQGLMKAAQRYGARTCAATVRQLVQHEGRVVIHTSRGTLSTERVIVAANAWIGELLPQLAQLIIPVRGQVLAYAPISPVFTTAMSASVTLTGEYWQQRSDGTIVLGGCRAVAPGNDVGIRLNQPTPEVQKALEQIFPRLFPALHGLQVATRWAGVMAFTPDYLPIVDRVPDMPGVLVAGGFSGHGMPFPMRLGQLIAESLSSGRWPAALRLFGLNRETLMGR